MAKYTLLIYGDPAQWEAMADEQFRAAAGDRIIGGQQLEAPPTATTLRGSFTADDAFVTSDGPFLETKEALGGFYMLEASDLDEVLALAELLPEVRVSHSGV